MKTKILLATLMAAALIACDSTSSNDANDNGGGNNVIGLSGSLLDPSGKGIPNAKVRLKSTGAVAITDANGKWAITNTPSQYGNLANGCSVIRRPPLPDTVICSAARAAFDTDSIVVSKDSQVIAAKPVVTYNAELPPMYIVQRDIFGTLLEAPIGKTLQVSGIVDMPDSSKYLLNFWYNKTSGSYSKFFYLLASDTIQTYRVSLLVRDSSGDTISKSKAPLEFTTEAGDIQMLAMRYNNFTPKFTFNRDSLKATNSQSVWALPVMKTIALNLDSSNFNAPQMYEWKAYGDTIWTITSVSTYTFNASRPVTANGSTTNTFWDVDAFKNNAIKVRVTGKNRKITIDSISLRETSWN